MRALFKKTVSFYVIVAMIFVAVNVNSKPIVVKAAVPTSISTNKTAQQLADELIGTNSSITISNAKYTGNSNANGIFSGGTQTVGFDSGIILSSGAADSTTGDEEYGEPGDSSLDALISGETNDASVLEFDFVPSGNKISFDFAFATYEDIGGDFSDPFEFLVDGENIALVPGTQNPMTIPSIYQSNNFITGSENPSFSKVFTVTANVTPNQKHHIKLAIADNGDDAVNSNVYIKAGSMSVDEPKYTVDFKNYDGSEIGSVQTITSEGKVTEPTAPIRTGYTFGGWYKEAACQNEWDFANDTVTADTTLYAKWIANKYTVTFNNYDGTVLSTQNINYGSGAVAPANPSRAGYTFDGWDKDFSNVTGDLAVTAKYTQIPNYTVTFNKNDGDNSVAQTAVSGSKLTAPTAPTRTGYTFGGWYTESACENKWDFANDTVTANTTLYAKWTINEYTVTFKDYNGTVLSTQNINYESSAVAPENPARVGYTFSGWDKAYNNVTGDLTVTATYAVIPPPSNYTVVLKNSDGSNVSTETVVSGNKLAEPTAPTRTGYTFGGWYKEAACQNKWDFANDTVTADTILYAKFTINKYTVMFKDYNGTVLNTQSVNYGSGASAPTNPVRTGYTFAGWDKAYNNVTGDLTIAATYKVNQYTLTYAAGSHGSLTGNLSQTVSYGENGTSVIAAANTGYHFVKWSDGNTNPSRQDTNVSENKSVTAEFAINSYTVTFKDYNGTVLSTQNVNYGLGASAPENPVRTGYTFAGWDRAYNNVTGDLIITATYKSGDTYTFNATSTNNNTVEATTSVDYLESRDNTLVIKNNIANVSIPASAVDLSGVSSSDYIKVTEKDINDSTKTTLVSELPSGINIVGNPLELNIQLFNSNNDLIKDIHQFANNQKVKVTVKLTSDEIKGLDTSKLSMYYYDETNKTWIEIGGSYDPSTMEFTFYTPHFTKFALMQKVSTTSTKTATTTSSVSAANTNVKRVLPKTGSLIDLNVLVAIGSILIALGAVILRRKKTDENEVKSEIK